MGLGRRAGPVDAGAEELMEHVVLVGGENQAGDRKTHHARDVAGADVAEVARGHAEGHLFVIAGGGGEPTLEVIDHLGQHSGPVDGIDRADPVLGLEGGVVGDGLDDILGIIEHAAHGNVEDVPVPERVHLGALEGAHPALRGEHEDLDVLLAQHGVLG